jgi:DNA-binding CsgD family transcriptional regulator/tetratricopeptide (TPR) repeat protein
MNEAAGDHAESTCTAPLDASAVMSVLGAIGTAPLVGRESERSLIGARLAATGHASGGVILISGVPGVGKTRLAVEVAAGVDRIVISLRCDEQVRNLPYSPFLDPAAGLGSLASLLTSPGSVADSMTTRRDVFEEANRLIIQRAGENMCVLLVDQLEWIDAASLDLLRYLVRRGHAMLATMRVGACHIDSPLGQMLADWNHERLLLEVPLAVLDRSASDELVTHLLGAVDFELRNDIHSRTNGHPFLVEELVRFLITEGYIGRLEGVWSRAGREFPSGRNVSSTIIAAVMRRHDHLPAKTRDALNAASVLGEQCLLGLLAALVESTEADLIEALSPAVDLGIFGLESHEVGNNPSRGGFKIAILRDVYYASLSQENRLALHRRAAEVLARTEADRSFELTKGADAALLAHHAERAHEWKLAYDASLASGDAAVSIFAGRDALTHFNRARRLSRAGHVASDARDALALDRRIVTTLRAIGRYEEAAAAARIMADRAATAGDRSAEAWAWIWVADPRRTFGESFEDNIAGIERGQAIAENLADDGLLAAALAIRGALLITRGSLDEAEVALREALSLADRAGDRVTALRGRIHVGFTASWRGRFQEAISTFKGAVRLAEAAHDGSDLADARFGLALALAGYGEYDDALGILHDLIILEAKSGEPFYAVRVPNTIGWIYRELALVEQALAWDERAVAESEHDGGIGRFKARANSLLNVGMDLILLDRLDDAETILDQSDEAIQRSDYLRWRTSNRLTLCQGELALARGDNARALKLAANALAQAASTQAAKHCHQAHDLAGRALTGLGRYEEAIERLEQAASGAARIEYRAGHWRSLAHWGDAFWKQVRASEANQRYAEAVGVIDTIAHNLHNPVLRAAFVAAPEVAALLKRAKSGATAQPSLPMGLSAREIEVLCLVADGLTNSQIAERLFLSPKTVSSHLMSVFSKLGVTSRASATRFALEHGLV